MRKAMQRKDTPPGKQKYDQAFMESFVRIWQASRTKAEAARELNISSAMASGIATRLRRNGVALKKMHFAGLFDYGRLAEIAKGYGDAVKGTAKK